MTSTWFVKFPTHKYEEDVKALAATHDLKIVDERFKGNHKQCANAPELTVKGTKKPRKKAVKKTETEKE